MGRHVNSRPPTDTGLLRQIRDLQHPEAWREFVGRYTSYLQRLLVRRGIRQPDAEDAIQETFIAVVNQIGDFQHDRSRRFRNWLATIALRKAWRLREKEDRQPVPIGSDVEAWEAVRLEEKLEPVLQRLQTEVNALEWEAFRLTVLDDVPNGEAAERLGIKIGYLFTCKSRVKKVLMRILEEMDVWLAN